MSDLPSPGIAYKRPAANVVRAACPGCGLQFDQPLAEETEARVQEHEEVADSVFRARLAGRVQAHVDDAIVRSGLEAKTAYAGLLDILRAEGIWSP